MNPSPELELLTRRLLDLLGELTGLESTYLTAVHAAADEQEILYSRNVGALEIPEGLRVEWGDTLCRRALESGTTCTDDVPSTFPGSEAARVLGLRTYVTVPVNDHAGAVVGTLCGASASSVAVAPAALAVMRTLAEMVELQLANDRAMTELVEANTALERAAHTDGLTGVGNRRALEQHLERWRDAGRSTAVVVTVDVDHFKVVNDTHGHGAGDDVLLAVAERLRSVVRSGDAVVRLGGDEFAIILADTVPPRGREIGDRIRADVAAGPITTRVGPVLVTISVGVATGTIDGPDGLLARADEALYAAKAAGRDGVAMLCTG